MGADFWYLEESSLIFPASGIRNSIRPKVKNKELKINKPEDIKFDEGNRLDIRNEKMDSINAMKNGAH